MNKVVVIDTCAIIHLMHSDSWNLLKQLKYSAITTDDVQEEFEIAEKKGRKKSYDFFMSLINNQEITIYPLQIDDLITMANIPESKNASKAELSCFALAYRLGCQVMTDDEKAVKYIKNHLIIPFNSVMSIVDIALEAYVKFIINDTELRDIQKKLEANQYKLKLDLVYEGARRRSINGDLF